MYKFIYIGINKYLETEWIMRNLRNVNDPKQIKCLQGETAAEGQVEFFVFFSSSILRKEREKRRRKIS